jgi:hypothetical protein
VELHGTLWRYDEAIGTWVPSISDGVAAEVYQRMPDPSSGAIVLLVRSLDNQGVWSVPESAVLSGVIPTLSNKVEPTHPIDPVDGTQPIEITLAEYKARAAEYVKARDAFAAQEKAFELVKKQHRDYLIAAIKAYGKQKDGSESFFMERVGFYSQVVIVPQPPVVEYNKDKIVEFLYEHGLDEYLSDPGFDEERWNTIKRFTAQGNPIVDPDFVKSVETVKEFEARESLCINTLK